MKITSTEICDVARRMGWEFVREAMYGTGGEKDAFRNSHEANAMALFINSRQDHVMKDFINKIKPVKVCHSCGAPVDEQGMCTAGLSKAD